MYLFRSGLRARIPSKKIHVAIILVAVFSTSFLVMFLVIYLTPSPYLHERAYSMPTYNEPGPWSSEVRADYLISPVVNDTNVPLDAIIVVDQMRPMGVEELLLSPEAPIARRVDERSGLAGRCTSFYLSEPLKPATTYNVTLFFGENPISWNFTTTAEPYHPRYEALPSGLGILLAATISAVATLGVGVIVWKKKQR